MCFSSLAEPQPTVLMVFHRQPPTRYSVTHFKITVLTVEHSKLKTFSQLLHVLYSTRTKAATLVSTRYCCPMVLYGISNSRTVEHSINYCVSPSFAVPATRHSPCCCSAVSWIWNHESWKGFSSLGVGSRSILYSLLFAFFANHDATHLVGFRIRIVTTRYFSLEVDYNSTMQYSS